MTRSIDVEKMLGRDRAGLCLDGPRGARVRRQSRAAAPGIDLLSKRTQALA